MRGPGNAKSNLGAPDNTFHLNKNILEGAPFKDAQRP